MCGAPLALHVALQRHLVVLQIQLLGDGHCKQLGYVVSTCRRTAPHHAPGSRTPQCTPRAPGSPAASSLGHPGTAPRCWPPQMGSQRGPSRLRRPQLSKKTTCNVLDRNIACNGNVGVDGNCKRSQMLTAAAKDLWKIKEK